jgi:hypothetical protein
MSASMVVAHRYGKASGDVLASITGAGIMRVVLAFGVIGLGLIAAIISSFAAETITLHL